MTILAHKGFSLSPVSRPLPYFSYFYSRLLDTFRIPLYRKYLETAKKANFLPMFAPPTPPNFLTELDKSKKTVYWPIFYQFFWTPRFCICIWKCISFCVCMCMCSISSVFVFIFFVFVCVCCIYVCIYIYWRGFTHIRRIHSLRNQLSSSSGRDAKRFFKKENKKRC